MLLNSFHYLTHTWWSMKMSPHAIDRSILHTQMDICANYFLHIYISCRFVTYLIDIWIIVLPSTAALRFSANNLFSIRKLEYNFFRLRVIVYTFAYGSKIVPDFYSKVERHLEDFLHTVSTHVIDMYHSLRLQCSTLLYHRTILCALFHYWSMGCIIWNPLQKYLWSRSSEFKYAID